MDNTIDTSNEVFQTVFIAFTTKGLEHITEREIKKEFPGVSILEILQKRILFSVDGDSKTHFDLNDLLRLKTTDDVHVLIKDFKEIKNLDENFISEHLPLTEIDMSFKLISQLRVLDKTFSLTISKYKNNLVDLDSLRSQVSKKIETHSGFEYLSQDHGNFDIRIHVEGSRVLVSCRLSSISMYIRPYRICEQMGALKPTIAAALCELITPTEGDKIVDNFCGVGTILCEASFLGLEPSGGDLNEESVHCAVRNMKNLSKKHAKNLKSLDATATNWPSSYFDCAVSNLPWGKQVDLTRVVNLYSNSIAEYARILKKDGSIVLLGIKPDLIVKHLKKNFPDHKIRKFRIGFLGQTPWVVCAIPQNKIEIVPYKHLN